MKPLVLVVLIAVMGCQSNKPGITKDEAVAILKQHGYTDPILGATPQGWTGTAGKGGYPVQVTVDQRGLLDVKP